MSKRGFTLVELLVVIGIIAVLIAILFPALQRSREVANRAKCLSNVRQLALRAIQYANENRGSFPLEDRNLQFPTATVLGLVEPSTFRGDMFAIFKLNPNVWLCPTTPYFHLMGDPEHGSMYGLLPHQPWADTRDVFNVQSSYFYLGNGYALPSSSFEVDVTRRPIKLTDKQAATKTLFADMVTYAPAFSKFLINHPQGNRADAAAGGNQSFADGHGEWVKNYPFPLTAANAAIDHWPGNYDQIYWW